MSVLVVGISHNSAPVSLLERVAPDADGVPKLVQKAAASEHVTEATVISTCNRVEIYAEVDRFHGSVEELSMLLLERAGGSTEALLPHLYVHYDDAAVSHIFQVAAGLDSMVPGEGEILGQVRDAYEAGAPGPLLDRVFRMALHAGRRARVASIRRRAGSNSTTVPFSTTITSSSPPVPTWRSTRCPAWARTPIRNRSARPITPKRRGQHWMH